MVAYERFKMRGTIIVYFEIFYIDSKSVVLTSLVFAGFQIAFVFPSLFQIFFFCDPENAASDLLSKNKFVWSSWWTFFLVGFYAWIYAKQHKGFLFITWCQRRKYTNLFLFVIFSAVWALTIVMPVCTFWESEDGSCELRNHTGVIRPFSFEQFPWCAVMVILWFLRFY